MPASSVSDLLSAPDPARFQSASWRGAEGGHRLGLTDDGRWWWVDPDGTPRVVTGVGAIEQVVTGQPVLSQLRSWGFNLLGPEVGPRWRGRDLAHVLDLGLRHAGDRLIRQAGVQLPDVFDPAWAAACREQAAARVDSIAAANVLDAEQAWGAPSVAGPGRPVWPTLLQVCLGLDPSFAAYHAAWEFVLAPRGGSLATLARDWDLDLPNKETLRQLTREEEPFHSPGYEADRARFTREFAQRYYRTAAAAARAVDPGRLLLARLSADSGVEPRAVATGLVDALLIDEPCEGCGPVIVEGVNWDRFATAPARPGEDAGTSALERMVAEGRRALTRLLQRPEVVGYLWSGFSAGDTLELKPCGDGLVFDHGGLNNSVVQPLAAVNAAAVAIRAGRPRGA